MTAMPRVARFQSFGGVELCDGEVEGMAQAVFQGTNNLAAVFEDWA